MPNYILRDLPANKWERFKRRGQAEGWPLRALFMQFISEYGAGNLDLKEGPGTRPERGFIVLACPNGHELQLPLVKTEVKQAGTETLKRLFCPHCGAVVPVPEETREDVDWWLHTLSPPDESSSILD